MRQYTKTMLTFFVLVILLTGMYVFTDWFSKTTGYVLGEDEKTKLAQEKISSFMFLILALCVILN